MQLEMKSKEIDGIKYEFGYWPMTKQMRWEKFLIERLGKGVAVMFGALKGGLDAEFDGDKLGQGLSLIFEGLSDTEYIDRHKELIDGVLADGVQVRDLEHFNGRKLHLKKVCYAVLEVQFADYFLEGAGLLTKFKAPALKSPTTLTTVK